MPAKKTTTKKIEEKAHEIVEEAKEKGVIKSIDEIQEEKPVVKEEKPAKKAEKSNKYAIGSIVYVSKNADTDLEGFKLFPQYKKYTYTVEAYDEKSGVYSLRRLNLSLKLKEVDIVAPEERAHDSINRRQF